VPTEQKNVTVFGSRRLSDFAKILLPKWVEFMPDESIEGVASIYFLRNFLDLNINHALQLRKIGQAAARDGNDIILDIKSVRNELMFYGIKHRYLPSSESIYTAYRREFNLNCIEKSWVDGGGTSVLIFPFGSQRIRWLPQNIIDSICVQLRRLNLPCTIVVHKSDFNRINHNSSCNIRQFNSIQELVDIMSDARCVVTTDSLPLHLAFHLKKLTYVVSNMWTYFIPPELMDGGQLFRYNQIELLYDKISSDLNCR
jgi:hypothetical protein